MTEKKTSDDRFWREGVPYIINQGCAKDALVKGTFETQNMDRNGPICMPHIELSGLLVDAIKWKEWEVIHHRCWIV